MGIIGLQSYMERQNLTEWVNIKELAERFREKYKISPVLVVDGSCWAHIYRNASNNALCGGQLKEMLHMTDKLFTKFQECGIKCVFFFDGPLPEHRREIWIKRRLEDLTKIYHIMDCLETNENVDEFELGFIPNYWSLHAHLRAVNAELIQCTREADAEIIDYIHQHRCFGIIGQDSDFAIVQGVPHYFSIQHLDINEMCTIEYRQDYLALKLRFRPDLLPLLATLSGNDVVWPAQLRDFHLYLLRREKNYNWLAAKTYLPKHILFPHLANWINGHSNVSLDPQRIAEMIGLPELADKFLTSVNSYYPSNDSSAADIPSSEDACWDQILKEVHFKMRHCYKIVKVYSIVVQLKSLHPVFVQYYTNNDYPFDGIVTRNIRLRLYGVLLKEHPQAAMLKVDEYIFNRLDDHGLDPVSPIYPDTHPGLLSLWPDQGNVAEKWKLFGWIFGPDVPVEKIRALSERLHIPTLALFYLTHEFPNMLQDWEVTALALQAVRLMTMTARALHELQCKTEDAVAVHLATAYLCLCFWGATASDACGHPTCPFKYKDYAVLDGKLFHTIYLSFKRRGISGIELDGYEERFLKQMLDIINS